MHKEINIIDNYYWFLRNLNEESKLELISKLTHSLIRKKKKNHIENLYGAFQSDLTAEEILKTIKDSRSFLRKSISL